MPDPCPKPTPTASQRGKAAKRKGYRAERQVAADLGGERVPLSGALGGQLSGDVVDKLGMTVEVKQRADGFKALYGYLEIEPGHGVQTVMHTAAVRDGRKQAPDYAVVGADNSPRLAVMPLATLLALQDRLLNAERRAEGGWVERAIEHLQRVGRGA